MVANTRWATNDVLTATKLNASIQRWGADADKPTPTLIGDAYLATDTKILYVSTNGTSWDYKIPTSYQYNRTSEPITFDSNHDIPHLRPKAASATLRHSHDSVEDNFLAPDILVYWSVKTFTFPFGIYGTLRIAFDIRNATNTTTVYGQIYKNGAAIGTEQSTTSQTFVTKTEDIAVGALSPGDTLELFIKSGTAGITTEVQNFRISYDNAADTVLVAGVTTS